jgi:N-acetylglucosamine-6-sulfatase
MASGLYPIKNGATNNSSQINPNIITVDRILHDNGYYTALLGKNHGTFQYTDHTYDFWMASQNDDIDPLKNFQYNGVNISLPGFITEILTDTAVALIDRVNKPIFMWLAYRIPHFPIVPEPQYVGLYDNDPLPLTNDTLKYTENYPSFLDDFSESRTIGGQDMINTYLLAYEAIASMDSAMSRIYTALENTGKLDNTLLIFLSDNGHMYGEHTLFVKRLAYEPSLRIPLFMRYPKWFNNASVITNQIAMNVDIAPTILDAAGIPNTYGMDGSSLHDLYSGKMNRTTMYYEYLYSTDAGFGDVPSVRGIRDLHYKYIYYGCTNGMTEEFFNLDTDPEEMTNLINTGSYQTLISQYQGKLTFCKKIIGDTLPEVKLDCYIKNPVYTKEAVMEVTGSSIRVFPNPTTGNFTVVLPEKKKFEIEVMNAIGNVVLTKDGDDQSVVISMTDFPEGVYLIRYHDQATDETIKW